MHGVGAVGVWLFFAAAYANFSKGNLYATLTNQALFAVWPNYSFAPNFGGSFQQKPVLITLSAQPFCTLKTLLPLPAILLHSPGHCQRGLPMSERTLYLQIGSKHPSSLNNDFGIQVPAEPNPASVAIPWLFPFPVTLPGQSDLGAFSCLPWAGSLDPCLGNHTPFALPMLLQWPVPYLEAKDRYQG